MIVTSQFRLYAKRHITIFSGAQPSGELHLGNYFGACRFLLNHQERPFINESRIRRQLFSIVDWHSMTVPDRKGLRQKTLHTAALLLAAGFDPSKTVIFRQSDVLEHAALMWILLCRVPANKLTHMIQWKVIFVGKSMICRKNPVNLVRIVRSYPIPFFKRQIFCFTSKSIIWRAHLVEPTMFQLVQIKSSISNWLPI